RQAVRVHGRKCAAKIVEPIAAAPPGRLDPRSVLQGVEFLEYLPPAVIPREYEGRKNLQRLEMLDNDGMQADELIALTLIVLRPRQGSTFGQVYVLAFQRKHRADAPTGHVAEEQKGAPPITRREVLFVRPAHRVAGRV